MSYTTLPKGWVWARLGDITEIVGGGTPSRDNPSYFGGSIPWATPTDITRLNDLWINETAESITEKGLRNSSAVLLPAGTVLMTSRASIGLTAINSCKMCTNQGFASLICNEQVIVNAYLAYWLPALKEKLIQLAGGTTFKEISKSTLARVEIPLPPLSEQYRITVILREADEICRLRRQASEKAQQIFAALFYEMFGDPIENDRKWKTTKIHAICDLVRGSSPRPQGDPRYFGGPIPRLMVADITRDGSYVTPRIDSLTEEGAKASRLMNAGAVVMVVSGSPGLPAILTVDACIHDGIVGFRNLSKLLTPEFFLGFLLAMKEKNTVQAVGATFHNLTTDQISNWSVLLPPIELQERYTALISEIRDICKQNTDTYKSLETLYQSLLAQAFSGELTAAWREIHTEELVQAVQERDKQLERLHGAIKPVAVAQPIQIESQIDNRKELITELSNIQNVLLKLINKKRETYFIATKLQDDIQTCFEQGVKQSGWFDHLEQDWQRTGRRTEEGVHQANVAVSD